MTDNLTLSSFVQSRNDREQHRRFAGCTWLYVVSCLLVASLLLASCAEAPAESRTTDGLTMLDRLEVSTVLGSRVDALPMIAHPLADAQLRVSDSAAALLSTDRGRSLFVFLAACALPGTVMLTAQTDIGEFLFFGEAGLAPQWLSGPLNPTGQRWVSACVFARVNGHEVANAFSGRGPSVVLNADADERAAYSLEEGAYYGNMFVPADQPIQWFACRGRDQAATNSGDLVTRDCSEPDPAKPSVTKCGFAYAGDCGSFAADRACESFSPNGTFYRRCHTAPIQAGPSDVFEEVITTFVRP